MSVAVALDRLDFYNQSLHGNHRKAKTDVVLSLSYMKKIVADASQCSGCRICEMICSFSHERVFSSATSRVTVMKEDNVGLDFPVVCWHCNSCPAMENCPTQAMGRDEGGLIFVDGKKCVGCGKCLEACTIGALRLHPASNAPLICDQCGGEPECVGKCPAGALTYAETSRQPPKIDQTLAETRRRLGIID